MKTIDEVIEGIRDQIGLGDPVLIEALHYLREYLDYQKQAETVIKSAQLPDVENRPLTWDELKQMEGKPVWIEHLESGEPHGEWLLMQTPAILGDVYMVSRYRERIVLYEPEMGKTWQAYRKERE